MKDFDKVKHLAWSSVHWSLQI